MDGKFVDNKTYDHEIVKEIGQYSKQIFDCHLMVEKPELVIEDYAESGADIITFHYEATQYPHALIKTIKSYGLKAGISIKPDTDVEVLNPFLKDLDLILIMSVEPGKGGQKFMPVSLEKIAYLNKKRKEENHHYLIEVDGGINFETAKAVKHVGCDVIVVGSFIFNHDNRNELIEALENVW